MDNYVKKNETTFHNNKHHSICQKLTMYVHALPLTRAFITEAWMLENR